MSTGQLKQRTAADSAITLWRRFILEADRVYRSSPTSTTAWERHKKHRAAAMELCRAGDIPAARLELKKALAALQSATITQPELVDTTTMGTKGKPVSPYCPASGCWCSAGLPEHMDPSSCRNCPPREYPPGGREAGA